ncbi:hypothetical protein D9M73_273050 [compost metagenome]
MLIADIPSTQTNIKNRPIKPVATKTDFRAALASGTVKNRIMICGRPATPNTRPNDIEIMESGSLANFNDPSIAPAFW